MATQLGALGVNQVRRPDFHLPPSQLVRHTEASTTPAAPFPACSTHWGVLSSAVCIPFCL